MKISELPNLEYALKYLGVDIGALLNSEAELPEKWAERAALAEKELEPFTLDELETFVCGETETEQAPLRVRASNADAFLLDAFDGDLSDLFYEACVGFAYNKVTADASASRKALEARKL